MWLEPMKKQLQVASTATGDGTIATLYGRYATAIVQWHGGAGVITFKGTVDGTNWVALACTTLTTGATTATAIAAGIYSIPVLGMEKFKAEITTHTTAGINVVGMFYDTPDSVNVVA